MTMNRYVREFADIGIGNVAIVEGKNASLGEMFHALRRKIATPACAARHPRTFRNSQKM